MVEPFERLIISFGKSVVPVEADNADRGAFNISIESSVEPLSATITSAHSGELDTTEGRNSSISFLPFQFKMTIATFFILVAHVYVSNVYGSIASRPDHARSFSLKVVRIAR